MHSLARLLLIGTANEPNERQDTRTDVQPHGVHMLEAMLFIHVGESIFIPNRYKFKYYSTNCCSRMSYKNRLAEVEVEN